MEPAHDIQTISSVSALLAALSFGLAGSVVLSGRRRRAYLAFILLCTNLFFWHLCSIFRSSELMFYLGLAVLVFVPVNLLLFLRTWLGDIRATEGRPGRSLLLEVPRSIWGLLALGEVALGYAYTQRGQTGRPWAARIPGLLMAATLLGLYGALSPLWRAYLRTLSRVDKRRLLYLLLLGAFTITVTAVDYLPPPYGRGGASIGSALTIVYLYFLQQTLFLDRLLDLNELFGKVVVLSAFVLLLSAILTVMSLIGVDQRQLVPLLAVIILVLYEPLRNLLERQVHRWTYRERYELKLHLDELRQALTNIIDLREAVRRVLSLFEETGRMTHAAIYLLDPDGSGYDLAGHIGPRPVERLAAAARRPLLRRLARTRQPVTLEGLERERQALLLRHASLDELETLDAVGRTLLEMHAGVVIGIFGSGGSRGGGGGSSSSSSLPRVGPGEGEGEEEWVPGESVLGVLCLKDERVSDAFTPDELEMLSAVAAQIGITAQNSALYERMKERDRLAALGEMAAGLAHEIRNPLGAIKGAAEFIAPGPGGRVPDDAADFLQIIVEETRRLNKVVSQFLDYARPYRGEMAPLEVADVVRKTLPILLGSEGQAGRVEIDLELQPGLPRARGDAEQLRQVFLNLALNALQAMEPMAAVEGQRPRLVISTGVRRGRLSGGQMIEVRFSDNGPGIPPSTLKNLFIPFFTTKERGTGLGLPISQRIIENHGGFIEVRSRVGVGSTFTVVLPVSEAPPGA